MLKGIDVASYQGNPFNQVAETAYNESDFVIAKTTQGTTYVNRTNGDYAIQRAKRDGKLFGFYHYATGADPVAEADFFYNNSKNYFNDGIPCLDWESGSNKSWGNTTWARRFVDRIHQLSGVWCMIYVQASAISQVANCANDCALWVAGYPDLRTNWSMPTFRYNVAPWSTWTVWQYTSGGGIDRNFAQLDREGWLRIAQAQNAPQQAQPQPQKKSVDEIAREVLNGQWGNGNDRKNRLEQAGYNYNEVQAKVNELAKPQKKSVDEIAREVIQGKWGNNPIRAIKLKAAGYDPNAVQARVNQLM